MIAGLLFSDALPLIQHQLVLGLLLRSKQAHHPFGAFAANRLELGLHRIANLAEPVIDLIEDRDHFAQLLVAQIQPFVQRMQQVAAIGRRRVHAGLGDRLRIELAHREAKRTARDKHGGEV